MTVLNTLSQPALSPQGLKDTLALLRPNDTLLLLQDAVVMACQPRFTETLADFELYVLSDDLTARGLALCANSPAKLIDYAGFVALSCQHQNQVTW
ncbi:sulfurtransferase complex subunit TusB [Ferrimonas pelagia]|uniref:tRNA 2-thiouridine synthesizing protein B n=1 Tax=Ferrimonas pelagia TaxID=1177826 RepID=A0ABP9FHT1_9GAMM